MSPVRATLAGFAAAAALTVVVASCSSVPDVRFGDDAGPDGTTGSSGGQGGGRYRCPDRPPDRGGGVCCGDQLCLGEECVAADCERCLADNCAAKGQICCRTNPGRVKCQSYDDCDD